MWIFFFVCAPALFYRLMHVSRNILGDSVYRNYSVEGNCSGTEFHYP